MQKQCVDTMGVSVSQRVEDNRMIRWRNFMNLSPAAVFRDEGPAYPYVVIPEFATVTYMKNEGPDNDAVINMPPGQMPADFFDGK